VVLHSLSSPVSAFYFETNHDSSSRISMPASLPFIFPHKLEVCDCVEEIRHITGERNFILQPFQLIAKNEGII
jgi:hypothetical protein